MKRQALYIIVCSFVFSLLLSSNRSEGKAAQPAFASAEKHILKSGLNSAETEAGLSNGRELKGTFSSYRIHGPAVIFLSGFREGGLQHTHTLIIPAKENFSCKAYLFHNYPSHNFW